MRDTGNEVVTTPPLQMRTCQTLDSMPSTMTMTLSSFLKFSLLQTTEQHKLVVKLSLLYGMVILLINDKSHILLNL